MDGYVTEKLLYAAYAGAIPIYWGTDEVFKLFNRDRVLYWTSAVDVVGRVRYLESNRTAYDEMHALPIFAHGQPESMLNALRREVQRVYMQFVYGNVSPGP